MRVQLIGEGTPHRGIQMGGVRPAGFKAASGPWLPEVVLGAESAGGLMLPDASPTVSTMYAPRGVYLDDRRLVVCDTGNHRVMIWNGRPAVDGGPCDVVVGQPTPTTEGPQSGGAGPEAGMYLPTGVLVTDDGRLVVADAWNHRILIWNDVPDHQGPANVVIGQPDAHSIEPNGGGEPTASVFYWPFGIALVDGRFYVTDTGNRRVLVWSGGLPEPGQPADVVLGQSDETQRDENAGDAAGPRSFRWPHDVCSDGRGGVLIVDAGNHRVLGWSTHPESDGDADLVLGQPDFTTAVEFPYAPQQGTRFRFPYAMCRTGDGGLAVGDTANNRVLWWDAVPSSPDDEPNAVLGQPDFASNGENRWQMIAPDTVCWPYGLAGFADRLVVADSGNNRVVVWARRDE